LIGKLPNPAISGSMMMPFPSRRYSVVSEGTPRTPVGKIVMLRDFEATMHGKTRNYLFFDFHVEILPNTHPTNARPQ
jgi:prepilin-type processing-associated H-X9-DG protein